MTDTATASPVEGRRRLAPFGNDFPEHATPERQSPIPAALDSARDGLHYTDAMLEELDTVLGRLIAAVTPVLTDGQPAPWPMSDSDVRQPAPEDNRSTIARSIGDLEQHARRQGDTLSHIIRRIAAVTESVEA